MDDILELLISKLISFKGIEVLRTGYKLDVYYNIDSKHHICVIFIKNNMIIFYHYDDLLTMTFDELDIDRLIKLVLFCKDIAVERCL